MTDFTFVMVTHIYYDSIGVFHQLVELFGIHVNSFVGDIEGIVIQSVSNDFPPHLHL